MKITLQRKQFNKYLVEEGNTTWMKQVFNMQNSLENDPQLRDDLILKFADESFTILDAVEFEVMTINDPTIVDSALTNRSVRQALQLLPVIKAKPGFEERLNDRISKS